MIQRWAGPASPSGDKNGAYYCSEAETELFLKEQGLSVYNRIVYVECEFTRLAHAKRTLHTRKFPKREQKIIVAHKGNIRGSRYRTDRRPHQNGRLTDSGPRGHSMRPGREDCTEGCRMKIPCTCGCSP